MARILFNKINMNKQNVTLKKAMIEALEKSLGVVTTACKNVGIARNTHYLWMREDEEYREEVNAIENIALDFVESQLFKNIKDGKTSEMIFYLKTKGKKRGYIERQEITGADGMPTNFQIEIIKREDKD